MDNYEDKSDFDINKAVAEALGNKHHWEEGVYDINRGPSIKACICCRDAQPLPNYCNNPSDAWPIITENKIGLVFVGDFMRDKEDWQARDTFTAYKHRAYDENPLRAAMIVFLKMERDNE